MSAEFAETRTRMSTDEKWFMLAHVLHFPDLFQSAAYYLRPEYFSAPDEPHFRLLWATVLGVAAGEGGPGRLFGQRQHAWGVVATAVKAAADTQRPALEDAYYAQLFDRTAGGLLFWIYADLSEAALSLAWGRDLLSRFLDERYVQDYLTQRVAEAGGQPLAQLPTLLREVDDRRAHVTSITRPAGEDAFPLDWQPTAVERYPTGVPFLDGMLNGGHVAAETYGLLGGFGSGKTTLGTQILVGSALYAADRFKTAGVPLRHSCLFHYEAGIDEMRRRILSHAAGIDRDALEKWGSRPLSTTGQLLPYERTLFADQIKAIGEGAVPGEYERFQNAIQTLRVNVRLFDMSGPEDRPKQGSGGVAEIAQVLERERREGRLPCCVVIDYAGLCVRRHVLENNLDDAMNYRLLTSFGHDCLRQIAAPFKVPVWILHQLSGAANQRTWASKQHHSDAAGSKSFAENLWFCFQLGTPHQRFKAMRLYCTKARRADIGSPPLVYLKWPVSTMMSADHLTENNGEIYEKNPELPTGTGASAAPDAEAIRFGLPDED